MEGVTPKTEVKDEKKVKKAKKKPGPKPGSKRKGKGKKRGPKPGSKRGPKAKGKMSIDQMFAEMKVAQLQIEANTMLVAKLKKAIKKAL